MAGPHHALQPAPQRDTRALRAESGARTLRALGLMSGTSLDGVDVALIETDGERVHAFGPVGYRPYSPAERDLLRRALDEAVTLEDRAARPGALAAAEVLVTAAHAEAVETYRAAHGLGPGSIDVIGFHGQTVLHRPERRLTVQIGDAAALADRLALPVVFDLRAADVAAGGQGAPLVPAYHRALARELDGPGPVVVVNVGGVANVTVVEGDADPLACDTGPGNALIDDFVHARTGQPHDADGRMAAAGRADEAIVSTLLQHPFFALPPPKSLDRNAFRSWVAERAGLASMTDADGAATLTALTAASIAAIRPHLARLPARWIVAGGGARNPTLMRMLAARLAPARVETAAQVGWSIEALEAQAFAFLAVRSLRGLPLSFPRSTGVPQPMPGGRLAGGLDGAADAFSPS